MYLHTYCLQRFFLFLVKPMNCPAMQHRSLGMAMDGQACIHFHGMGPAHCWRHPCSFLEHSHGNWQRLTGKTWDDLVIRGSFSFILHLLNYQTKKLGNLNHFSVFLSVWL